MIRFGGGCSVERHVELAKSKGALGVILLLDGLYICNLRDRNSKRFDNTIPTICIQESINASINFIKSIYQNYQDQGVLVQFYAGNKIFFFF